MRDLDNEIEHVRSRMVWDLLHGCEPSKTDEHLYGRLKKIRRELRELEPQLKERAS